VHGSGRGVPEDTVLEFAGRTVFNLLTLILLMLRIGRGPNNASRWQMGFNSSFKGLKPSGFFTYHHSKIVYGARFALSVLYGSQNRQRPLLYMSLTG